MIPNLTRTFTPWVVAWLVGWLSTIGINVTDDQRLALVGLIGTVAAALYHLIVHVLERKWPKLSVLLGSTKQPTYEAPAVAPALAPVTPADPDQPAAGVPPAA